MAPGADPEVAPSGPDRARLSHRGRGHADCRPRPDPAVYEHRTRWADRRALRDTVPQDRTGRVRDGRGGLCQLVTDTHAAE